MSDTEDWFSFEPPPAIPAGLSVRVPQIPAPTNGHALATTYKRTGNRVSILPIAQFCGKAPVLSEQYGAGRAAAMSTAFHAWQAGAANQDALFARLTEKEKEEVLTWNPPATVHMADGCILDYADAAKEIEVALDAQGNYVTGGDCLTVGHVDFAWAPREVGGMKVAFVGDIKKTIWTTEDGPESLQLHGYGWALARKFGCDAYCPGLWCATEGEWLWAKDWVVLDSDRGRQIWQRLYYAATHRGDEATTGEHCRHCWARMHCGEHLLPAVMKQTFMAPFAEGGDITAASYRDILMLQALEDAIKLAKEQAKIAVKRGIVKFVDPNTGKSWRPVMVKGKESVSVNDLRAKLGAKAELYISRGSEYPQFRWQNTK